MSHMGTPNSQGGGSQNSGNTPATGRDAWNNPIQQDQRRTSNASGDDKGGGNNDQNQNDDGINDDVIDKIWDKVENGDGNDPGNKQTIVVQQQAAPVNKTVEEQQQEYLKSIGLDTFAITDAEKEAIGTGDYGPLMTRINSQIVQSHVKALSGAKTMIDKAVADAVKTAKTEAAANQLGRENISKMNEALPYTKERAYAPVAATVMQRLLDRGMDTEKAIQGVKMYFEGLAETINGQSVNKNRNQNFSVNPKRSEDQNWVSVLSPQR